MQKALSMDCHSFHEEIYVSDPQNQSLSRMIPRGMIPCGMIPRGMIPRGFNQVNIVAVKTHSFIK